MIRPVSDDLCERLEAGSDLVTTGEVVAALSAKDARIKKLERELEAMTNDRNYWYRRYEEAVR